MQSIEFSALAQAENSWNVKHPVLDRVRRCSAEPEKAAAFFAILLFPGLKRPSAAIAQRSTYLKSLNLQLQEHYKHHPLKPCKPITALVLPA